MSERAQLALEGASLEAGQSVRLVCPFCGGGSTRERSLVLTLCDDGAILYVCHRAHCPARGRIGGGSSLGPRPRQLDVRPPVRSLVGEVRRVPEEIADDVAARYHFRQFPEHWRWDATFNRLLFPVLSPKWERRGWVSRRLGSAGPKSLNEKERLDEPWLHWASNAARRVYLVEDIPSAERLAEAGHCAVASMGCHLADDCAEELIRGANGRSIYVTYDRDAVDSSFAIVRRLSLRSTIWAALLPKDIKDMTHEELSNWLNAGC